ncbi:hypothetical protein BGX21_008081 [Mortierella sp. AD011]|nr:hypothetical protein BGX20_002221 [Mortierella sp. AD010]KAF9398182.1 hypothetical protein BGX21_008081 [Mortierella sp. AD011]
MPTFNRTLQQRRASGHLPASTLALSSATATVATPAVSGVTTRGGYQSLNRIQSQPLSPQDWQGLVASGAQPVRKALHSFIATSCEKPPETKEEARAVLEEMFQIRANRIRQAIEEGQLATAEALKHKVIQRRESVVEGSLRKKESVRSRAMSAPSEGSAAMDSTIMNSEIDNQSQSWLNLQMTEEPCMGIDNTATEFQQSIPPVGVELFGEQVSTFGLSDDDLMSSFTTFTAKLGDSLLAKSPLYAPKSGGILDNDTQTMEHDHLKQSIPSLSPPSDERSPATSNESPSNSPWMPWVAGHDLVTGPQSQQHDVQLSFGVHQPSQQSMVTLNMQRVYPGVQPTFTPSNQPSLLNTQAVYSQTPFSQGNGVGVYGDKSQQPNHRHQADTWSQYMQYLLYQQELGLQPTDQSASHQLQQYPQPQVSAQQYQQSLDPHWQATMMTMMMDQSSVTKPSGEFDRGMSTNVTLQPGLNYPGQQPSL